MKNKGIIAINKPQNWTSFDAVNKIKYMVKPLKAGHLGTLDPMATGVLLITIGKATKLFDLMQEKKKTYVATFEFGVLTDTLDATGIELSRQKVDINYQQIEAILPKFIGKISQIPPKYSAKSINGVRAYTLARNNVEFELKPKEVKIYDIKILDFCDNKLKFEITCGSGTYIRAIGRDIAKELNTVATMTSLIRTQVGKIGINKCHNIENLSKDNIMQCVTPISEILDYKELKLSKTETFKILNGQIIDTNEIDGTYALKDEFDTIALVVINENKAKMSLFLG